MARKHTVIDNRKPREVSGMGSVGVTNDGNIRVSQSRVKSYRQCKQQHHYKFNENIKPKRVKRPFQFGRIVHSMIEAYAEGDDPFEVLDQIAIDREAMFRAEAEMYGNIVEDIRLIMTEYFDYWPEDSLIYQRRKGRSSEHKFELELEPGLIATGILDAVGKARRMKWLVEHKTFKRKPSDDDRWRSVQSGVYIRVSDILGWFPGMEGVLWDYVKSAPPTVPEVLQSGKLSTAKRGLTLPTKALEVIRDNNLDPKDYKDFLELCKVEREDYFFRIFTPTSRAVVDSVWNDFVSDARDIAENGHKRSERNIGRHCSWCDYEQLCRAAMQGSDVDFLKEHHYVPRNQEEHEAYQEQDD